MYIRPHLDFCDVIYHIPKISDVSVPSFRLYNLMNAIEKIQYQAALAITGTWKGTNLDKVYEQLGGESLTDRRWFRRLTYFYKIYNNYTPEYLQSPIPPPRTHLYGNRSDNVLHGIFCRTNRYKKSLYPHSIQAWNDIGPDLRQAVSLNVFKTNILKLIRPLKNDTFDVYDPNGIKRLFQLRVGLRPLNDHKKRHNFRDTRSDVPIFPMRERFSWILFHQY